MALQRYSEVGQGPRPFIPCILLTVDAQVPLARCLYPKAIPEDREHCALYRHSDVTTASHPNKRKNLYVRGSGRKLGRTHPACKAASLSWVLPVAILIWPLWPWLSGSRKLVWT
jgi:hypothetical protein